MKENENQIVVYQPDEVMRLEVRLENETVWLNQSRMGELFDVDRTVVNRHIRNIYLSEELDEAATCAKIAQVQAVNSRLAVLEDKVDRRLAKHDDRIAALEQQVDIFVKTNTPQGIFYEGQLWDACSFVEKLIAKAKASILLIDSWVDVGTLDMLAKKHNGVAVEVVASKRGNKLAATDVAKFNAQYGPLTLKESVMWPSVARAGSTLCLLRRGRVGPFARFVGR